MIADPAAAALLLALAVTLHNVEEMIRMPGFSDPYLPKLEVGPVAFRFAAIAIALLFWLAAFALFSGIPIAGVLAGFAVTMVFNALVPHLALTLARRRYHPGTATAWLLVVPAAAAFIASSGGFGAFADRAFVLEAVAGFLGLAVSLPILLTLGGIIERRMTGPRS